MRRSGSVQARGTREGFRHRLNCTLADQHISLHREVGSGDVPEPVACTGGRSRRRCGPLHPQFRAAERLGRGQRRSAYRALAEQCSPALAASRPSIPRYGLTQDCVETAPTPGFTKGQMPPTPGTAVDTATPSMPVFCAAGRDRERVDFKHDATPRRRDWEDGGLSLGGRGRELRRSRRGCTLPAAIQRPVRRRRAQ